MLTNLNCYDRAQIIAGRSLTRSKAPGRFFDIDAGPLYARDGIRAILIDVEGREYIDMLCGLGGISLGYQVEPRSGRGIYSLPHIDEILAAEWVLAHVAPWASSVRFTKTGSEATHAAYRVAKAATGRTGVLIGDWAYHGWHEWCADPTFPSVLRYPHGQDMNGWRDVAAVFVEPHRWEPVSIEWLRHVREWCTHTGALLVFDEMIYGGRWALGGASEYFGVHPDLACYGKAFGGGQAVAFVVGTDALAKYGELVSGTYSGDVTGLAAVIDILQVYTTKPVIETLWARGRQLQRGLSAVIPQTLAVCEGQPVHQRVRFLNPTHGKRFAAGMAQRGVLWHPDVTNVMYAHTPEQIEHVVVAAEQSCRGL